MGKKLSEQIEDLEIKTIKKYARRDKKKMPSMKVSGTKVKKLSEIIRAKNKLI